jgi:drug/metabolite transporter (DMT)-like permease
MNSHIFLEHKNKKILFGVWMGIGLTIALDTAIQLSWKSAVANVPSSASARDTIMLMLRQPLCSVIIILFLFQFVNWMKLLSKADLSYIQPLTALSLASVTGFSYLLLHEHISLKRVAGMVLILAGVWFISMTKHKTTLDASKR